jgi:IS1 family transposase
MFVTDNWEGFKTTIPDHQLFSGKDLTTPIEQDNSNIGTIWRGSAGAPRLC